MTRAISSAVMILGAKELGWRGCSRSGSTQALISFHRRNSANWRAIPRRPTAEPGDSASQGLANASADCRVSTRSSAGRVARNLDRRLTR
jgi:hypothetical protein